MSKRGANLKVIAPLVAASAGSRLRSSAGASAGAGAPTVRARATRAGTVGTLAKVAKTSKTPKTVSPSTLTGSTQRIVDAITTAIVERRLMPGTKLGEQQIADLFKVSRTLVRQALNQLSRDRLITLEPARGAFVSQPSVDEARQVFEVRRLIESQMARELCAVVTDGQVRQLRHHLAQESEAVARVDVAGRTRLLADFHVVLARLLGNEVLAQLLADLLARCSLISLMYQSSHSAQHSAQEHVEIVDAIERRDARAAARLMSSHLGHVERNLQLSPRMGDLAHVLQVHPLAPTLRSRP